MSNMFWFDQAPHIDSHKHPHGNTRKPSLDRKQAKSDEKRLLKLSKKLIKKDRLRGKTINIRKNKVTRVQITREDRKWRPDKTRVKRFADELYEFHKAPWEHDHNKPLDTSFKGNKSGTPYSKREGQYIRGMRNIGSASGEKSLRSTGIPDDMDTEAFEKSSNRDRKPKRKGLLRRKQKMYG